MGFTAEALFLDFCLISVLLFLAKLIRLKVPFFQNHFIPTALIAGLLAVLGGKNALNILPFSDSLSAYCGPLQIMLSASLFIGEAKIPPFRRMLKDAGDSFFLNCAADIGQFGVGILAGAAAAKWLFPGLNESFGFLMPAGFAGSHGTAAIVSDIFEGEGFVGAFSIGQTFATVGLLTGIFLGVFFVNYGAKKGYTKLIARVEDLPAAMKRGLVEPEEQEPFGRVSVNSMSLDTLSWHIALVFVAVGIGYLFSKFSELVMPDFVIPVYGIALVGGIVLQNFLRWRKLDRYTDPQIIKRIGGSVTDYMVVFGVASIDFSAIGRYWLPILLLCAVGWIFSVFFLFVISKRCFQSYWFERGIFIFGWCTASMPVALMLLRLVDPDFKSEILKQTSFAWIFLSLAEIAVITFAPMLLIHGYGVFTGVALTALALLCIIICRAYYGKRRI